MNGGKILADVGSATTKDGSGTIGGRSDGSSEHIGIALWFARPLEFNQWEFFRLGFIFDDPVAYSPFVINLSDNHSPVFSKPMND